MTLKPESTIGILGGGQLGRMLALAAARLGLRTHILSVETDACAYQVSDRHTVAEFTDHAALEKFAQDCDVITYEFENVPADTAAFLAARKPVFPDPKVLATTQDRLVEKQFVTSLGIATAPFAAVGSADEARAAAKLLGLPAVLKTRRFGYDGKGQVKIGAEDDPVKAWESLGKGECILEGFIPFEREVSVVAARSREGQIACFDLTENEHRNHILYKSTVPAHVPEELGQQARRIAETLADAFQYVGVFAVEMFVVKEASGHRLLVNEIAPRVHNSGHWTIDGATVSQFEQHIRAVAGWPLGKPVRHGRVEMINLIGPEAHDYAQWLAMPGTCLHLYGKGDARPGRKMGHVTRILD